VAAARARSDLEIIAPKGMYTTPSYNHVARVGNLLFLAGQVARDQHGNLVAPNNAAAQARQVYRNIGTALAAAGAGFGDVVKITTYLLDRADSSAVTQVRYEHLGDHRPPHTGLIIAGLGSPEVRLEVDVVAVAPARAASRRAASTRGAARRTSRRGASRRPRARGRARRG
jgi:2-iminobutanoate/2-iminopropanoate deaminase